MEKEQYKILFELEDDYWWHVGLRSLIASAVTSVAKGRRTLKILDAGCGTGGNLAALNKLGCAVGIDLSEEAIHFSKERGMNRLAQGSVSDLPFKEDCFDVLLCVDVLYHQAVENDEAAIKEFYRVLKRGGILILHLPAFEFLKGPHDKAVHAQRRYVKSGIKRKLTGVGFRIKKINYRNFILFFLMLILRRFNKKDEKPEFRRLPGLLNRIFLYLANIENLAMRNINIPLGTSIFSVSTKDQA